MPTTLVYKVVTDNTAAANLLLTGGLTLGLVFGADVDRLLSDRSFVHKVYRYNYVHTLLFNQRRPLMNNDKALRKAISTVVDPKAYNQAALAGRGDVSPGLIRPGNECYNPGWAQIAPKPSLAAAKKILTDAGYTYSGDKLMKDGKQLSVTLLTNAVTESGPAYLQNAIGQLGIDVNLNNAVGAAYGTNVIQGNFDILVLRGSGEDPSPGASFLPFWGPPAQNRALTGDRTYNLLVVNGLKNTGKLSCQYFDKAIKRLLTESYARPLVAYNGDIFAKGLDFKPSPDATFEAYYLRPTK
jgi:peptide/nickel transport system substrate-binding protein